MASKRSDKRLVSVNCASIPENLLESELFGYEKGAFTDATRSKEGIFEKAHGGSLFLDEIGEMSLALQAKLLRVIENKRFRRLGATTDKEVDVRIIAATNRNLEEAISAREFRKDLYYRLNVLRIEVPPLRKRDKDVLELAEYFLLQYADKFKKKLKSFDKNAKEILLKYSWPGNVRELKNVIERIAILHDKEIINGEELLTELGSDTEQKEKFEMDFENDSRGLKEIMDEVEARILTDAYKNRQGISRKRRNY